MPLHDVLDISRSQPGGVRERVQTNDGGCQSFSASQVECRASNSGGGNSPNLAFFIAAQSVPVNDDAADRLAVSAVQLGWQFGRDPA